MAPLDRSNMSSYWHSTVTMALSCVISDKANAQIKQDTGLK